MIAIRTTSEITVHPRGPGFFIPTGLPPFGPPFGPPLLEPKGLPGNWNELMSRFYLAVQ